MAMVTLHLELLKDTLDFRELREIRKHPLILGKS